jgi:hypothetical protein
MADIQGLDHFADYFKEVNEQFVIVGGVASALLMDAAGQEFRKTVDIDLVIIANLSDSFTTRLSKYIKEAGYKIQEGKLGKPTFYRFREPSKSDYPFQIEIFSSNQNQIKLIDGQHIIPIDMPEGEGQLSAILLEDEYFQLIKNNRKTIGKHSIATEAAIIPLKARAYNDISDRGGDSREAKKHRNDVMKLALNLEEGEHQPPYRIAETTHA